MKNYDMKEKLDQIESVIAKGPFKDDWDKLASYHIPKWYDRLRFGIFIHYGVFSVPAYANEWYPRLMYDPAFDAYEHHLKTYGKHTDFGYKDFIPMFKAEKFDADRWINTFKDAGAQYVIPVAEHHDGFQMYESDLSSYNALDMGPHRNILLELKDACERKGIVFGASSHRIEHYFFQGVARKIESDIDREFKRGYLYWPSVCADVDFEAVEGEGAPSEEYMQDWLVRTCEIIDRYRPYILYFDWWIQRTELKPYLKKLLAYYYNRAYEWNMEVVINYKHDAIPFGIAVPDIERGQMSAQRSYRWQSDTAMCFNSWCYTKQNRYKKSKDILCDLIDIISKNGTMLLNIGPKADGTFSDEETRILSDIGKWLKINHEAVFDAIPYKLFGEGPTDVEEGAFKDGEARGFTSKDFRFMAGNGFIYIFAMRPDENSKYTIKSFANKQGAFNCSIKEITCLNKNRVSYTHDKNGLHIECRNTDESKLPVVFKVSIA